MHKRVWPWFFLSVAIIALDQWSKFWVVTHLEFGIPDVWTTFFNLTLSYNQGSAFSFLGNAGGWQRYFLLALSSGLSLIFIGWLIRAPGMLKRRAAGLSCLLGGAIGNSIDRFRFGYVVDFFDFHIKGWHYATFNVADVAICVGAVLFALSYWWAVRDSNAGPTD